MANLKDLFDRARAASEHRSYTRGLLGKPDGTISVPGRPTHVYVRVSQQGGESLTTARNLNTVPNRLNLPVRMRIEPGAGYVIVGIDSSYYDAATVNDTVNDYGLTFHTHRLGSGMEYEVEALRLEPGRVFPTGSWGITVNPFRYYYNGAWETYEGEDLDLLANRPSTAGKHRLVVISVNPLTNAAAKTNGSDFDYATTLAQADIDAISIGNNIPLCAVRIRADDSSIDDISRFIDAGGWRNRGATVLSELIDVELTTPADGDALTYDSGDGVWKNTAGGGALSGLTDVNLGSLTDEEILQWDAGTSKWINAAPSAGSVATLGDVNLTGLADNEILVYDSGTSKWINSATLPGAVSALPDLSDVTVTSVANKDTLQYDSGTSQWKNVAVARSIITDWSYRNTSRSATLYAWKGNRFLPDIDVILYALCYFGTVVANGVYQAAVVTGTGSPGNINTITFSNSYTVPASPATTDGGFMWLEFATPVTLTAGTAYGLMVGRTDSTGTYALPIPANGSISANNGVPMVGRSNGDGWRIAVAVPAPGDAINQVTSGDAYGMGFRFRYPGSLY